MHISASVQNSKGRHRVLLKTNDQAHSIAISPKPNGMGSSVNGGELLLLALATCYCNDVYREASRRKIVIDSIEVDVDGEFGAEGEPAKNVKYRAKVSARGNEREIRELLQHTDTVAEIQNTLRAVTQVVLKNVEVTMVS